MKRSELEHIIRAAGSIVNARELIVVGSQAILASFPDAPAELTISHEADLYPPDTPELAIVIDGSIGERSPFHQTFGYHGHGVAPETAVLPREWKSRLVRLENENTNGIAGLCISAADLAVSKLVAGREKDMDFVTALFRHRLVMPDQVRQLLNELDTQSAETVAHRTARCARAAEANQTSSPD